MSAPDPEVAQGPLVHVHLKGKSRVKGNPLYKENTTIIRIIITIIISLFS